MAMRISEAADAAFQELVVQHESQYLSIPCLMGGVGIGKTETAADLCARMESVVQDSLLCSVIATGEAGDPTDIAGVPWVVNERVQWLLNSAARRACETPVLLVFDDIDKATPIVINGLLKLFIERSFKDFRLHPKSLMMCAGNRVADDIHANALSESIRTRITIIEVETHIEDFVGWATRNGEQKIHPLLIGWLLTHPEYLHKPMEGVMRFSTPRGLRELSLHMFRYPDPKGWKATAERKIGSPAGNDFWVWYTILRKIDVDYILEHGELKEPVTATDKMPAAVAEKMGEFAAVFAVVDRLNQKLKSNHAGLEKFIDSLSPELRVAFLLQMKEPTKREFVKHYKKAAGQIMGGIIKDGS